MKKLTFFKFFLSGTFSWTYLLFIGTLTYWAITSYFYAFYEHEKFDFTIKELQFSYLVSDTRGKLPHVFQAYKGDKKIMAFSRHSRIPALKKMLTNKLPEAGAGKAYYVYSPSNLGGISNIRTLLGVEFSNGISIGIKKLPEHHTARVKKRKKEFGCIAILLLLLSMSYPTYVYYKYKEMNNA